VAQETNIAQFWQGLLASLENKLNKPIYETLLSSTKPLSVLDGKFIVAVPNEVIRDWVHGHSKAAFDSVSHLFPEGIKKVDFIVGAPELFTTPKLEEKTYMLPFPQTKQVEDGSFWNPRYTFDTFVVGHGNRFAHAASLAVAETPAKAYNPLFIYGGVGLGKTHLMQAIAHSVLKSFPRMKVLYATSETFTNELIGSIQEGRAKEFRDKYRSIDLLLVDDIQFLAGKERTQEEFFHTFNALYEASKQIVLSSDRPPKEIPTLEERLRSRFEWGLIADIQSPDLETRIAILKKKADIAELSVPDEVMTFIATKMTSNIRELEGALIRVVAYASLTGQEINVQTTEGVLRDIVSTQKDKPGISIDLIKKVAAEYYSIKLDDMSAKIRTKEIATARQVAMYLARELTTLSLPKIGEEFGGRDHTTVMHAYGKISEAIKAESDIEEAVRKIKEKLGKFTP
jgi:chromosomal replication initiator protein